MQANPGQVISPALLDGLFDYAGLFPPAEQSMHTAVAGYLEHSGGGTRALLNAFVLKADQLPEFSEVVSGLAGRAQDPWSLSVLSTNWQTDERLISEFLDSEACAAIVAVETRIMADVPSILQTIDRVYVELNCAEKFAPQIRRLSDCGGLAKIRAGGLSAGAFPDCRTVAEFLHACVVHNVSCKATAGLHHPVRSKHYLSSANNAPVAVMHGFVNLMVAVAASLNGAEVREIEDHLLETDPDTLESRLAKQLDTSNATQVRSVFHSIGSCSFTEPVEDLRELGWLN